MLQGFEHIGMTVSDLDRSLTFYRDLLGLKLVLRKSQHDGGEVAFLDAGGGQLELTRPAGHIATPARFVGRSEAGLRHVSLTMADVEASYRTLMAAGVKSLEAPRVAYNKELFAKVAFVLDPDEIVIELIERIPS